VFAPLPTLNDNHQVAPLLGDGQDTLARPVQLLCCIFHAGDRQVQTYTASDGAAFDTKSPDGHVA
jgi:hypothetical protein